MLPHDRFVLIKASGMLQQVFPERFRRIDAHIHNVGIFDIIRVVNRQGAKIALVLLSFLFSDPQITDIAAS